MVVRGYSTLDLEAVTAPNVRQSITSDRVWVSGRLRR